MRLPLSIQNLINEFSRLPGVGPKTSERLVFSLLQRPKEQIVGFAEALREFSRTIHTCSLCFNFADKGENSVCAICTDTKRDTTVICVVADSLDLIAMESTGYVGVYHVLGGLLNPLRNIAPEQIRMAQLITRINQATGESITITEIILAFDPNQEGELTAGHIKRELGSLPIKITRLARGLPQGADLDYADQITLSEALKGRRAV